MMQTKKYFFIGIKGSGMSALAMVVHDLGYQVAGSDIDQYTFTQKNLEAAGIPIYSFDPANIRSGWTYIAGNAFQDDHPEIKAAHELGAEVIRYHDFLGQLMGQYTSIGVAGTHGKTSTTGLLAHVLSGVDKTAYLIGDGTGKGEADAKFFVFEADEYRRHFLAYHPDYVIMTNVDFDHPDYYHDLADVFSAFEQEARQTAKGIFAWGDDPSLRKLQATAPIYYYGLQDDDDFQAINLKESPAGSEFDVRYHDQIIGHFVIHLYGQHSILNSLAVIGVSYLEGLAMDEVAAELLTFAGVKRRFAEKHFGQVTVIDDYAHHPSEIRATIDSARQKYPERQLVVVFQPHTYSRTQALMPGFAASLDLADQVYLTEIFGSAREQQGQVSSADLGALIKHGGEVLHLDQMQTLLQYSDAVVVFMGAGDIQKYETVYEDLLKN
ncbi:UDP-N-acetylmuramate--L-alanine ligase [Lapidilactobacillus achengensis]|uniref:UDP-N-acetylmuramate--L-alanine ligase n=1 Tax=Lapidilactobacillus achengensis TaxID=2486000 RepID=A0ABW1UR52_9LACO|nr:UDP-N-acetylmuramate--L-alanine ligase [Lapidilactobacillus achengensis]